MDIHLLHPINLNKLTSLLNLIMSHKIYEAKTAYKPQHDIVNYIIIVSVDSISRDGQDTLIYIIH